MGAFCAQKFMEYQSFDLTLFLVPEKLVQILEMNMNPNDSTPLPNFATDSEHHKVQSELDSFQYDKEQNVANNTRTRRKGKVCSRKTEKLSESVDFVVKNGCSEDHLFCFDATVSSHQIMNKVLCKCIVCHPSRFVDRSTQCWHLKQYGHFAEAPITFFSTTDTHESPSVHSGRMNTVSDEKDMEDINLRLHVESDVKEPTNLDGGALDAEMDKTLQKDGESGFDEGLENLESGSDQELDVLGAPSVE